MALLVPNITPVNVPSNFPSEKEKKLFFNYNAIYHFPKHVYVICEGSLTPVGTKLITLFDPKSNEYNI